MAIGLLVALGASLISCTSSQELTSPGDSLSGLPGSDRLLTELPEGSMTNDEALQAIAGMRHATVDDASSTTEWISTTSRGSFEATGHLGGSSDGWSLGNGQSYTLQALEISERVGTLRIVHAIPLVFGEGAGVTLNGRPTTVEEVQSSGVWDSNVVHIEFSVQSGWIRADVVDFTDREFDWGGWPEDYPPTATISSERLSIDASLPAGPGQRWLSLKGSEATSLRGYFEGGLTMDPPDQGLVGSIDLTVPDRLGSAAIYHVAQVFYDDIQLMPQEESDTLLQGQVRDVRVAVERGWLMGQSK